MKFLVTGGAGFIGSHVVDRLVESGADVVVIDALEKPTHQGIPYYINPKATYYFESIENKATLIKGLKDASAIIHLAATGGFTDRISAYAYNNSYLTAIMLETIKQNNFPIKKIVAASSVAVYGEGKYRTYDGNIIYPKTRSVADLNQKKWEIYYDGKSCEPMKTDEQSPISPANFYALSKYDQERMVQFFCNKYEITYTVFRFFLCYGPRQSATNPYTGVCSNFTAQMLSRLPVLIYEDGHQTRDFIYVSDVADVCIRAINDNKFDNKVMNVGTGKATRIIDVVDIISKKLNIQPQIQINEHFRISDSRHVVADITALNETGFSPAVNFEEGIEHYLNSILNK